MKHTAQYAVLTDPRLPPDSGFRHMSYAIFRTDDDFGRVIGARFPAESLLGVGDILQSRLHLSDEALAYLIRMGDREPPLFCLSDAGLGILCKRYDAAFGVGLYLHIHARPEAGARLLCAGALGSSGGGAFGVTQRIRQFDAPPTAEDALSFPPLLDAWRAVQHGAEGMICRTADEWWAREIGYPTLGDLQYTVERMAEFAGCSVRCEVTEPDRRVACYRPAVIEALLLCLLTEIRAHSVTRGAAVGLSAVEDPRGSCGYRLCLSLSYAVDTLHMTGETRTRLSGIRQYLADMAELSGLDVFFPPLLLPDLRTAGAHRDFLSRQTVTLEWLTDPTRLPSGDLKTRPGFHTREDWKF